jgi:hypothetical protein
MKMPHPCSVCGIECEFLFDEYYRCPRCRRCYGFKDDEILGGIEKVADRKKAGRPLGSKNKRRLEKLGLLRKENKDDKKD